MDRQSRECLACHDGTIASSSSVTSQVTRAGLMDFTGGNRGEHPVGIDYRRSRMGKRRSDLRPLYLLPAEVELPEGKVGCVSCHSIYGAGKSMMTLPTARGRLCLACHDK
jgi:predicted CXXCH cytochrome family protein